MRPDIAVGVPTFNRAALLEKALNSLIAQSFPAGSFEIVVLDNGSTDGTREVVRRFEDGPVRVRYCHEPRQGVSFARNRLLRETDAEVVAFIDDDAWAEPDWLQGMYAPFQSEPRRPLGVGGKIVLDWEARRPGWLPRVGTALLGEFDHGSEGHELGEHESPFGASMAFDRAYLAASGGFDTHLGRKGANLISNEEVAFFRRIRADGGRVLYAPSAVVHHRVPGERLRLTWFLRRMYAQGVSEVIEARDAPPTLSRSARKLVTNTWRRLRTLAKKRDSQSAFSLTVIAAYQMGMLTEAARQRLRQRGWR